MSWFDEIEHVKSENAHTVSPLIEHEWIDVDNQIELRSSEKKSKLDQQTVE